MVNQKTLVFCENSKSLQVPEIKKEFEEEFNELFSIGVNCDEIEYLIDLKIKEKLTLEIIKD